MKRVLQWLQSVAAAYDDAHSPRDVNYVSVPIEEKPGQAGGREV